MENLLCNEVWLMGPDILLENNMTDPENDEPDMKNTVFLTKEDCEEALSMFLGKEAICVPERGYFELVENDETIRNARFKAINWLMKAYKRMNLSAATVFLAANYLDRFISIARCKDWQCWMFDLLSVACLSISSKFNETTAHSLHQFQMDFVGIFFAPTLIQRMELRVLEALDWRMDSITPFSYIHILIQSIEASDKSLTKQATDLLLCAVLDPDFLEFNQCVMAASAVSCTLEYLITSTKNAPVGLMELFIPQDQKDDLIKCRGMMEKLMSQNPEFLLCEKSYGHDPSSPVTVLKVDKFNFKNRSVDISFLRSLGKNVDSRLDRKRKREEP